MTGFWIRISVIAAVGLVGLSLVLALVSGRSVTAVPGPHLISMDGSAVAMKIAGETMRRHGQAMLAESAARGDQSLADHGRHWVTDGDALIQGGAWMAMNPTAPGSLASSPDELAENANWTALNRAAQAMLHDPSNAREVDAEALRWNGAAMRDEGRTMAEHARVMTEELALMASLHQTDTAVAADLRAAIDTMRTAGGHLTSNGQAMMDYADRIRRGMGTR